MRILFVSLLLMTLIGCECARCHLMERLYEALDHSSSGLVEVVSYRDLDDISVRAGDVTARVSLNGVRPLGQWPPDLSAEDHALFERANQFIETNVVGKTILMTLHQSPKGRSSQITSADLATAKPGPAFDGHRWNPDRPSGQVGWGLTDVALYMIEEGYTPFIGDDGAPHEDELRRKLFRDAEEYAKVNKNGIWQSNRLRPAD